MHRYRYLKDDHGQYAFNIPIDYSARTNELMMLDKISMKQFLLDHHFHSPYLHWYINYCCRDDYGVGIESVSAWAGIHYFAARRAEASNAGSDAVLTWPEGNGFLVVKLAQSFENNIQTEWLAYEVGKESRDVAGDSKKPEQYYVNCYDAKNRKTLKISSKCVVFSCPRFVANRLTQSLPVFQTNPTQLATQQDMSYSPWLIANVSVNAVPVERGADLAWDNVSYYSRSLGYIDAKHQLLQGVRGSTVLTYYLPLDQEGPNVSRKKALDRNLEDWKKLIVQDMESMHAGISKNILNIDLWIWGHGMIRPIPHFIWGKTRLSLPRSHQGIFYAHSDMSGISIFEEAFWQGITTAKSVLQYVKNA